MPYLLIRNEILEDRRIDIERTTTVLGRDDAASVTLDDKSVSRFHARLEWNPELHVFSLVDLGSSNGSFVNGARVDGSAEIESGDAIKLGSLTLEFGDENLTPAPSLPPLDAGPKSPTVAPPSRNFVLLALGALIVGVCGSAIYLLLTASDPSTEDINQAPTTDRVSAPSAPENARSSAKLANEPTPISDTPPPQVTEDQPSPPTLRTAAPKEAVHEWVLHSGRKLQGKAVAAKSDDAYIHLKQTNGKSLDVAREDIAEYDGAPFATDLKKAFDARVRRAGSPRELEALLSWCEKNQLKEQRIEAAQMIVQGDRSHVRANAVLGRYQYKGAMQTRDELAKLNVLDSQGKLIGTAEDRQLLLRDYLVVIGRPPLTTEIAEALGRSRKERIDALLQSPEHWAAWLSELLVRFLGPEGGLTLADASMDLAKDLAEGTVTFKEVFLTLARSDAVRVKWATPKSFACQVLKVFVGEHSLKDEDLLRNATRMVQGERVAVFGERGASREEFLDIVASLPAFFRGQLRYESMVIRGKTPDRRELLSGAMKLASDASSFIDIRKQWLLDSPIPSRSNRRIKDNAQFARSLWVDLYGRVAETDEERALREILNSLSQGGSLRGLVASMLASSPQVDMNLYTPLSEMSADSKGDWIRQLYLRLLGRAPTKSETQAARTALDDPQGGARTVIVGVVTSPEYESY